MLRMCAVKQELFGDKSRVKNIGFREKNKDKDKDKLSISSGKIDRYTTY